MELPLWLARALEAKNMVRLEYPKHYAARFREDLLAGPEAVDIRDRSNFFYEVCVVWLCVVCWCDVCDGMDRVSMSPPGGITHLPFSHTQQPNDKPPKHNTDGHGPGPREARRAPAAHRAHGLLRAALPPHLRRLAQRRRGRHDGLCQGRSLCAMDGCGCF